MIKALIVDDESNARESLKTLISNFCEDIVVIGEANSVAKALEILEMETPDVVFLDIEMPGGNGFTLLENLDEIPFKIIFTTAFDQYAIQAIKFSALDYLLKPIDIEELQSAVDKVKNETDLIKKDQYDHLVQQIKHPEQSKKIIIPDSEGLIFLDVEDIIRCESDSNYTLFYLKSGKKIVASKTLREFEKMLESERFYRVHRSHLINMNHMNKYIKGEGGYVVMSDDSEVEVSRRKKQEFIEELQRVL